MEKIVVYTAIFGGYNELIEQPQFENVDYVCFTDRNLLSSSWKVVVVPEPQVGDDNTRNNRYYKILPHLHLQDYQYSIYIDGNFIIKKNPQLLIKNFLNEEVSMACFDHNQTIMDPRNCVYQEYEAIVALAETENKVKDDLEVIKKHIDFLKSENYPENNGLISGGVLVRKHFDEKLIKVMEEWWYFVKNFSKRDQLSFNYVAWKHHFKYNVIPGDIRKKNDYVYLLGKHKSNIAKDLWKYKIKRFLGLDS